MPVSIYKLKSSIGGSVTLEISWHPFTLYWSIVLADCHAIVALMEGRETPNLLARCLIRT